MPYYYNVLYNGDYITRLIACSVVPSGCANKVLCSKPAPLFPNIRHNWRRGRDDIPANMK